MEKDVKTQSLSPSPFGSRDKLGYMLGNIANDLSFTFAGVFLLVFCTKVLGIPSAIVGTMFVIARFFDAFTDITMGRIADKTPAGKAGKFRPWILKMCIPVAFSSFLMYQSAVAAAPMWLKVLYMFVTYLLWGSIFYTSINIPYGSMASLITPDADRRASLSTVRSVGSFFSSLLIGVVVPIFVYKSDENGNQIVQSNAFPYIAAILSVLSVVLYLMCYFFTTERVKIPEKSAKDHLSLSQTAKALVTNRALVGIVVASIAILAAQLLAQSINQYLFIDYFKDKRGVMIMSALSILPGLLLAPLAVPLSRRFGKRELGIFGSICAGVSCLILLFMRTRSMWLYIIINIVGFLGFGIFNLIMWAFITDIIDDREVRTGHRDDGTVYAVYSFSRKIGQAIAGGLGGWTLSWIGFNENAAVQTESVIEGIYTVSTGVPAILYFIVALSLIFIYPLDKERVAENIELLKNKKTLNDNI